MGIDTQLHVKSRTADTARVELLQRKLVLLEHSGKLVQLQHHTDLTSELKTLLHRPRLVLCMHGAKTTVLTSTLSLMIFLCALSRCCWK